MSPGAMGAEEMQKAREIASKLKELPLGAAPEEYVVQPGDTLWDISDQFLDDPFWWPKLWSLNENAIQNPNLIYPGMVLLFTPSDGAGGPLLAARDTEALINPVSLESSTFQSTNPLAKRWRDGRDGDILDADELPKDEGVLSMGDFQASTAYAFRIPGFMTNEVVDAVGEVLSLPSTPSLAITGEVSFASFKTNPKEGERFLALRKVEDIVAPNGDTPEYPLYVYVATVGVVHLNASGVVSLLVEAGPTGVSPGDVLVPFRNLYVQVNPGLDTRKSSMRSRVVGVLDDNVWLVGEAQAVFLEKEGAVRVGEEIDLFMPPGGSPLFGEDDDELDRVKVGTARVVEVGNETVTAVILTATREITVGASTYARP
ncbi:MAG: LysM peptidoglycan-binding domain-containing protein [Silvanigrellales bacterium]|nr:LysM peptidoglycan-binding domain-containing protein [Silvanigrellales bacterium]